MTDFDPTRFNLFLAAERERVESEGSLDLAAPAPPDLHEQVAALGVGDKVRAAGHKISRTDMHTYKVQGPSGEKEHGSSFGAARQVLRHQNQKDADEATKQHAQFVQKLARSRPKDGFADVPHPTSGSSVRLYGGEGGQAVQDPKGHFRYQSSLEQAARMAASDDVGGEGYYSQPTGVQAVRGNVSSSDFDFRQFRLHLAEALPETVLDAERELVDAVEQFGQH